LNTFVYVHTCRATKTTPASTTGSRFADLLVCDERQASQHPGHLSCAAHLQRSPISSRLLPLQQQAGPWQGRHQHPHESQTRLLGCISLHIMTSPPGGLPHPVSPAGHPPLGASPARNSHKQSAVGEESGSKSSKQQQRRMRSAQGKQKHSGQASPGAEAPVSLPLPTSHSRRGIPPLQFLDGQLAQVPSFYGGQSAASGLPS
jgi:hypothetical protein